MQLDELTQERMKTVFSDLADRGMVDSPDGPAASRMRAYAAAHELDDEQLREVVSVANGRVHLRSEMLAADARRRKQQTLLTGLALLSGGGEGRLAELDRFFSDDIPMETRELRVARAAQDLVLLLGPHLPE